MDRRTVISSAACSVVAAGTFSAMGQLPALPVIGFLSSRSPEQSATHAAAFPRDTRQVAHRKRALLMRIGKWASTLAES